MIPILVTGAHRTGTTWVGKMLSASGRTAYISEPLNVLHRHHPGVFNADVPYWYQYICVDNESTFLSSFEELLGFRYHLLAEMHSLHSPKDFFRMGRDLDIFTMGRIFRKRPLLKDPFAVFSLPWFSDRLNCQIVVTIRHPAGFASSLKRLGWSFEFADLLAQPLLMRDYLEGYRRDMQSIAADDIIGQASLLWTMIYQAVHTAREQVPSVRVVRHEDLSLDPVAGYRQLYNELGLEFTSRAERKILQTSNAGNPTELSRGKTHSVKLDSRANLENWKRRLSPGEVDHIRHVTEDVACHYYPEEDWN
jgi:hypothetical protein